MEQTNLPSMKDYISIKCLGKMSGYDPYKVYEEDDWLRIMWDDKEHDLNIWMDDDINKWCWAIYPLKDNGDGTFSTDTSIVVASGAAKEVYHPEHEG